jgi:hypothetical protein
MNVLKIGAENKINLLQIDKNLHKVGVCSAVPTDGSEVDLSNLIFFII